MHYLKKTEIHTEETRGTLYVTDDSGLANELKNKGEAVLIYFHSGNSGEDFSGFRFGVEDPEQIEPEYAERVYRRLKGLPWKILETQRCIVRETVPEDVEDFFTIYSNPAITQYMENLYPDKEQEREYIRQYIEQVYTFYEFGVWTVVEKESGCVIGRAGFSYRPGYDEPELGYTKSQAAPSHRRGWRGRLG